MKAARVSLAVVIAGMVLCAPINPAIAHRGGLNSEGCHTNRKTGEYHCHRGSGPQKVLSKPKNRKITCKQFPPCRGCGCKGGPGYRSNSTGKCVGYKQLEEECGNPPTTGCVFENEPGTGANRACVLGE